MERKKLEHAIQVVRECTERLLSENVRMVKRYTRYYTDIQEYCQARDVYLRTQEEFDEICRFNEYRRPYGKKRISQSRIYGILLHFNWTVLLETGSFYKISCTNHIQGHF